MLSYSSASVTLRKPKVSSVIEPFHSGYFHYADVVLFYVEGPANELPLVLLHGTGSRWQPFLPILPTLAEKYHVFALDLRGHGASSHTPGAYSLGNYTDDIHQFIAREIQSAVVVYGHSLGGLVGINLAAQYPSEVRGLILGDPPLYYHDTLTRDTFWHSAFVELLEFMLAHPDPNEMEAWLAQNIPQMSPDRRTERVRSLETLDADVVRSVISNMLMEGISLSTLITTVACPTLLLRGNPNLGSALREQDVDFALKHFRKIRVLEMESVGHTIIPASLLPQLLAFIDAIQDDQSWPG